MRPPPVSRALRPVVALAALFALVAFAMLGAVACIFDQETLWICLNPETGKLDSTFRDDSHFVNGKPDPCHCFDPCGPQKSCPVVVDAGEPGPDCDAGAGDGG